MGRRNWIVIAAVLSLAACASSGDDGRETDGDGTDGPTAERTPVVDLGDLVGPVWVPISVDGEPVYNRGSYWEVAPDPNAPTVLTIRGNLSCNQFGLYGAPVQHDGVWSGFETWTTAAGCGHDDTGVMPTPGMTLWREGEDLVAVAAWHATTDLSDARFIPAAEPPPVPLAPPPTDDAAPAEQATAAERQAQIDAQAARRPAIRAALTEARARWDARGVNSYELAFEAVCLECPSFPIEPGWSPEYETTVADGVADSPWNDASIGGTVDSWFDYLEANVDTAWSMEVEFDSVSGNPTWISVTNREYAETASLVPFETFVIRSVAITPL